jgi:hypothetical protein
MCYDHESVKANPEAQGNMNIAKRKVFKPKTGKTKKASIGQPRACVPFHVCPYCNAKGPIDGGFDALPEGMEIQVSFRGGENDRVPCRGSDEERGAIRTCLLPAEEVSALPLDTLPLVYKVSRSPRVQPLENDGYDKSFPMFAIADAALPDRYGNFELVPYSEEHEKELRAPEEVDINIPVDQLKVRPWSQQDPEKPPAKITLVMRLWDTDLAVDRPPDDRFGGGYDVITEVKFSQWPSPLSRLETGGLVDKTKLYGYRGRRDFRMSNTPMFKCYAVLPSFEQFVAQCVDNYLFSIDHPSPARVRLLLSVKPWTDGTLNPFRSIAGIAVELRAPQEQLFTWVNFTQAEPISVPGPTVAPPSSPPPPGPGPNGFSRLDMPVNRCV